MSVSRTVLILAFALGGCASTAPRTPPRTTPAAEPTSPVAETPLVPEQPTTADFAGDVGRTARVGISSWEDGWKPRATAIEKGINVEVAMTEFVPADASDAQPGMRGTVRLRFDDGTDAGVALSWSKEAGGKWHPEGWSEVFRHGKRTHMYFAAQGGTAYDVWLTADLSSGPHARWVATAKFIVCTK